MLAFLLSRGLSVNVSMCVLLTPTPPAHTLSQSLLLCCADRGRASLWGLLSFRGLVPDQHGGKHGGRQVGMVLSVHIRFAH